MSGVRARRGPAWAAAAVLAVVPAAAGATSAQASTVEDGTWWFDALGFDQAHEQTRGEGATVAVIDTLIDPSVPDLAGADLQLGGNMCGTQYQGIDQPVSGTQAPLGPTFEGPASDHATSMVSLVVGQGTGNGPGGAGISGVAPDATVLFYSIADDPDGDLTCDGSRDLGATSTSAAIAQAVQDGADVISVSLAPAGAVGDLIDASEAAVEAGVVVVASAGNEGPNSLPAFGDGTVIVSGVGPDARLTEDSSYGLGTIVAAPGSDIRCGAWTESGWDSTDVSNGTSQAAAITSGVLALVKSRYPEATGHQLMQHLIRHTTRDELTYTDEFGFGIPSVDELLAEDPAKWADVDPIAQVDDLLPQLPKQYPDEAALASAQQPATPTPSAEPSEPADDPPAAAPEGSGEGGSGPPLGLVLGGVAVLAVLAGGGYLLARRHGAGSTGAGATPESTDHDHVTIGQATPARDQ